MVCTLVLGKDYSPPYIKKLFKAASSPTSDGKKLNYHFNLLVKKIEYTFEFKMQYWKVKTKEGYGVLHVLFRIVDDKAPRKVKKNCPLPRRMRGFVPHKWLSET